MNFDCSVPNNSVSLRIIYLSIHLSLSMALHPFGPWPNFQFLNPTHNQFLGQKTELTAEGIRCADHATPSIRKSWH
jgi:hypothetical protein